MRMPSIAPRRRFHSVLPISGRLDVLVAEDDEALRRMLVVALEACGLRVDAVEDGRRLSTELGTARALGRTPTVVLTDLAMPSLTGIDVIAECAAHSDRPAFVVITGTPSPGLRDLARSLGAVDLFPKPFDIALLCRRIQGLVQRAEQGRELLA